MTAATPTIPVTVNYANGPHDAPGGQFLIPRYYDGRHHPAGQIIGQGVGTQLRATSQTEGKAVPAVILTEGFNDGHTLPQFGSSPPAVMQPRVEDLSIVGWDEHGDGFDPSTAYVKQFPAGSNRSSASRYDGLVSDGGGGTLSNLDISHIPGNAIHLYRPVDGVSTKWGTYDRLRWIVRRVVAYNVFGGPWIDAVDCSVDDCETCNFRDWGVRFGTAGVTGAVQFSKYHCFAGGWEGAYGGGAAILIDGDGCHGTDCYGESAPIGVNFTGNYCDAKGFHSVNCPNRNIQFSASHNSFFGGYIKVGFEDWGLMGHPFTCTRTTPSGYLTNGPVIGIGIYDQYNRVFGTEIKFASTNTGGYGFELGYNGGKNLRIEGVTVDCSATASTAPSALHALAGTSVVLANSRIDMHVIGGYVGLDLTNLTISTGNFWNLTTESTTTPIIWPSGDTWLNASADPTKLTSNANSIWINGSRWCKQ